MMLRALIIAMLLAGCATEVKQPTVQPITPSLQFELEDLYRKGHGVDAMMKLSQSRAVDLDTFGWLLQKAQSGVPPFQYELSRQFQQRNMPGTLEWFAKAYVVRSLDFAECTDKARNPTNMVLVTFYAPLLDLALKNPTTYAEALEKAIEWERSRKMRPTSEWICNGAILPLEGRSAARAKQLDEIRAGISRLKLKGAGQ